MQITLAEAYAAADEKAANSKFKPRPLGKNAQSATPQVDGHIPRGASILIIQRPWIDLILDGHKTLEIRGKHCNKRNERIYLALSGGGGVVIGSATFVTCHGPLSRAEWAARVSSTAWRATTCCRTVEARMRGSSRSLSASSSPSRTTTSPELSFGQRWSRRESTTHVTLEPPAARRARGEHAAGGWQSEGGGRGGISHAIRLLLERSCAAIG